MKREPLHDDLHLASATDSGTARNGHASDGRFSRGNRCASGRKSRAAWREAFARAVSPSDLEAIARRAVKDARRGDARAREIVFAYCLTRPPKLIDVLDTRMDGTEHTDPDPDLGGLYD